MPEEIKKTTKKKTAAEKKPAVKKVAKTARKTVKKEAVVEAIEDPATKSTGEYLYGLGRRKEAVAEVRLYRKGSGKVTVNGHEMASYFTREDSQRDVRAPLLAVGQAETMDVSAVVKGGGLSGQAGAVRLGIARALLKQNETFRVVLKRQGFLHRDPRVKERKKYGLKRARRAPQWSKR